MTPRIPTIEQRKKHALLTIAANGFDQAYKISEYIAKSGMRSDEPVYYPMAVAFCVLYGLPFTRNHGYGKGDEFIRIPEEHLTVHREIMALRHKCYAHRQHDGRRDIEENPSPEIVLRIYSDSALKWDTSIPVPSSERFAAYGELAKTLADKCFYHMDRFNKYYLKGLGANPGDAFTMDFEREEVFLRPFDG